MNSLFHRPLGDVPTQTGALPEGFFTFGEILKILKILQILKILKILNFPTPPHPHS